MALEETVLDGEECDWCNLTEKKKSIYCLPLIFGLLI